MSTPAFRSLFLAPPTCLEFEEAGWPYDEACCKSEVCDEVGQGGCSLDTECGVGLICGSEGVSCPSEYAAFDDAKCCIGK